MTPEAWALISALIAALIGSILGPIIIEILKLKLKPKKKEQEEIESQFYAMIKNLDGFYVETTDKEKIGVFLENYRLAWLYAPDEVIESINDFLNTVGGKQKEATEAARARTKYDL